MSNDIPTSAPAAAPPNSTPAPTTPIAPTPTHDLEQLAQVERVDEYAEQRKEDAGEVNRDLSEGQRNFSRHQRQRKVIEKLSAENAALKQAQNGGPPTDATPDVGPEQAEQATAGDEQQPQEAQEDQLAQAVHQTLERERQAAVFRERKANFASAFPDYQQVLQAAPEVPIPDHIEDAIISSPAGPIIQYGLARPEGAQYLAALLQASPREAEKMIARWEGEIEAGHRLRNSMPPQQQYPQQRRVTQARPPIAPLRGTGAGPPRSLAQAAENMEAYARLRGKSRDR